VADIRDSLVIKDADLFLLTDLLGNVPRTNPNGFGLYYQDTRFLACHELDVQGLMPTVLHSTARPHFFASQVLTNPNLIASDGQIVHEQTVQIRRYRVLRNLNLNELLRFENFNVFPLTLMLELHFRADFLDMFEVRGLVLHGERGTLHPPTYRDGCLTFAYDGRDDVRRVTRVQFEHAPTRVAGGCVSYEVALPALGSARVGLTITIDVGPTKRNSGSPRATTRLEPRQVAPRAVLESPVHVETSNSLFNAVLAQSREDLRVLSCRSDGRLFPAAGIPWYATLFGRDSIIAALQDLWLSPDQARQTLLLLAQHQGTRDDPWRDEQPGKILHELRRGELATCGVVPFAPYYGTVDATPLWVMLLGHYYRACGDLALVRDLEPHLAAALDWLRQYGDVDDDGLVEYARRSASGLENQGWKDSWNAIVHADGSLVEPPVALVEVQAYAYAAGRHAARLYRALGNHTLANQLDAEAGALRARFHELFWWEEEGFYCLALDGGKRQARVISSNPGHALWCGIVSDEHGSRVAERLMAEDLFSGWGIRTLSTRELRYNPISYHLGTVWPHDNSLAALGLKRYGQEAMLLELVSGLFDAARHFPQYRVPELFCGFARSAFGAPVRYPVACSPQAWAALSWSALLQAMLGVQLDAPAREIRIVRPTLPPWLQWVEVRQLRLGPSQVDLRYERQGEHTAVDVASMQGDVRVTFVPKWDE
jgi:glycogen debranching enzyme